jgi:hypothetical protein
MEKARLVEIQAYTQQRQTERAQGGKSVEAQFNPETLKVSYRNENKGGDQPSGSSRQYVGSASSKMQVELLFDTTAQGTDVRLMTEKVAYFLLPKTPGGTDRRPPCVRFEWGTFVFEGVVESLDETLDYFSEGGVPLRATLALNLARDALVLVFGQPGQAGTGTAAPAGALPGTAPLATSRPGDSVQSMTARQGNSSNWKSIAAANNIDDPLHLQAGALLDLNVSAGAAAGGGISIGAGAGASAGGQAGFSAGLGGGVGLSGGTGAGLSAGGGAGGGAGFSAGAGGSASGGAGFAASTSGGASGSTGFAAGVGGIAGAGAGTGPAG